MKLKFNIKNGMLFNKLLFVNRPSIFVSAKSWALSLGKFRGRRPWGIEPRDQLVLVKGREEASYEQRINW